MHELQELGIKRVKESSKRTAKGTDRGRLLSKETEAREMPS